MVSTVISIEQSGGRDPALSESSYVRGILDRQKQNIPAVEFLINLENSGKIPILSGHKENSILFIYLAQYHTKNSSLVFMVVIVRKQVGHKM